MPVNSWPSILLPKTNQIQLSVFITIFHQFYLHSAPRLDQFNKIYLSERQWILICILVGQFGSEAIYWQTEY